MRQDDDDRRGRHVVAALNAQLVLVTNFRRGVLTGKHLDTLGEVLANVCADFGAELVELDAEDAEDDHVQLLVASPPQVAVARLVNSRKGVSARRLRQRYRVRIHRGTCGRRRISRPRLVAHRWKPAGHTSASSAPLAGRANPAPNGRACPQTIPVT
jgi:putative transposase